MIITNELLEKAEAFQAEAHDLINQLKKRPGGENLVHQDLMNTYLFLKIADLDEKLNHNKK